MLRALAAIVPRITAISAGTQRGPMTFTTRSIGARLRPMVATAAPSTCSDTQNGRVVSRAIARDPTMLLTAYQPLALTQFKRAGRYAPRRPKLWRVNESWGIPISGPMLAVSASKLHPMRFPTRMAITPSTKPRPNTIASAPTSQTGSPILAESQSVNNARGRPCRSLAETCSIPCGSTFSTCPRYSPPPSSRFSLELTLLIDISFDDAHRSTQPATWIGERATTTKCKDYTYYRDKKEKAQRDAHCSV